MTRKPTREGKCCRTVCQRRSLSPQRDGWTYVELPPDLGLKTGWWCPDCLAGLQRMLAQQGINPVTERPQ